MTYVTMALLWIHVIAVVAWFGASALMAFVIGPALASLAGDARREAARAIAAPSHRYYGIVGGVTILTGLVLAWVAGRFGDPLLWVSIVIAVFLAAYGGAVVGKRADALAAAPDEQQPAALARLRQAGTVELAGLAIVYTLMILLRFGY